MTNVLERLTSQSASKTETKPLSTLLSAIVPVFNEPTHIVDSISRLDQEIAASPFQGAAEIIVVDDGSRTPVSSLVSDLDTDCDLRVLTLPNNMGRWEARRRALRVARGEYMLFVDSRVSLFPGSLGFVFEQVFAMPGKSVWNGHVRMDDETNAYSRFWKILVEEAWPDFFKGDGRVAFGPAMYDRFPRGFGCLFAPSEDMRWAYASAPSSRFRNPRWMNDEMVLRRLVERHDFNLDPAFGIQYVGRSDLRRFVKHAHHRGVFFVDGFLRSGTRFFGLLVASLPFSALFAVWVVRRPRRLGLIAALPIAAGAWSVFKRRDARDTRIVALLATPWALSFGAGVWRGAFLALRDSLSLPRRDPGRQSDGGS